MDDAIKKNLQEIVDLPLEDKIQLGQHFLSVFMAGLLQCGADETKISNYILGLTRLFVSADHKCSLGEYDFFVKVTYIDLPFEVFYEITNQGTDVDFMETCFSVFKVLPPQAKGAAMMYGCALLSVDGTINMDEIALIEKMLEM